MQGPAETALDRFYANRAAERAIEADKNKRTQSLVMSLPADKFFDQLRAYAPKMELPPAAELSGKQIKMPIEVSEADLIRSQAVINEKKNPIITLRRSRASLSSSWSAR